jgi:SPP1 gp7 family putative phage head morphogenesis protein
MKGSFTDSMSYVMRAMRHGFSICEKIFDMVEVEGKAYYACTELRPKPPFSFYFKSDAYGTMTEFGQNLGGQTRPLDMAKFIHYVCNPDEDLWYGRSELRAAYRSWYMKDVLLKMQALWLERMAGGFLSVEPQKDAPTLNTPDRQALESALANVKNLSGLLLPAGHSLTVTQASGEGAAFSSAIEYHDLAIAKALLVPNLLGVSSTGQKTGSYSQSQTQLEAFFWTLNADSNRLQAVLDQQLFMDLYVANFGDGQYPCFKFKPASEEFIKWVVGQWATLIGENAVVTTEQDEAHLRTILNMPPRGPDDKPLVTPAQKAAQDALAAGAKPQASSVTPGGGNKQPQVGANDSSEAYARAHTKDGKPLTCSVAAFSRASQRVAFSVIATRTEMMAEDAAKSISGIVAKAVNRTLKDLPDMLKDPASVQDAVFDKASMSQLKAACKDAIGRGWDLGARQANNEIDNARKLAGQHTRRVYAALRGDSAAGFLDANGVRMAGNLADGARAIIQQQLLQAIKSGDRPEVAAAAIYQRLIDKGFTDLSSVDDQTDDSDVKDALKEAVGATSEAGTLSYLNTLTRTNIFESLNEARYAAFTDPDLNGFVEALEYSAILDDRTTEICQSLDGYTASSDSEEWDTYRPPNHYNCRSVLVPVTQVDGWDGEDDPDPTVEPQAGFGSGEK